MNEKRRTSGEMTHAEKRNKFEDYGDVTVFVVEHVPFEARLEVRFRKLDVLNPSVHPRRGSAEHSQCSVTTLSPRRESAEGVRPRTKFPPRTENLFPNAAEEEGAPRGRADAATTSSCRSEEVCIRVIPTI